jgi:uncharacterized phage protein (TIGR01671 family)
MRTIKFRAWDKKNKSMEYDITGFECNDLGIDGVFIDGDYHSLRDTELMQFTGLYYEDGREVYADDIVEREFDHRIYRIVWNQENAEYRARSVDGYQIKIDDHLVLTVKKVGNIWDNPELIGMSEPPKAERR